MKTFSYIKLVYFIISISIGLTINGINAQILNKSIPILTENKDTIGFACLSITFIDEIYQSVVSLNFKDGNTFILDRRNGEKENGQINLICDIKIAFYKDDYFNIIWNLGNLGYTIGNLYKLIDLETQIAQHITGLYLAYSGSQFISYYTIIDINTIQILRSNNNLSYYTIIKFNLDGSVEVFSELDSNRNLKSFEEPAIDDSISYTHNIADGRKLNFKKVRVVHYTPKLFIDGIRQD